LSVDQRKLIQN